MATTKTTTNSNLMTMKDMLTFAHDELHNSRALNAKDFEDHGVAEQTFTQWKGYVDELRKACKGYLEVAEDDKATDKKLQEVLNKVWMAWRAVCKEGAEKDFNKNFFIKRNDAHTICEWCNRDAVNTAHGKTWGQKESTNFRKHIETMIGIRMTGNAVLTDDERDLIVAYEGALRSIKTNEDLLNDTVERGQTKWGLRSQLKFAQNDLDKQTALIDSLKIEGDAKETLLKKYRDEIAEKAKAVAKADEAIKKATKIRDEKKSAYDKAIALVKSVGGEV